MKRFKDIKDNYKRLNSKGFTLIELLGVVAIIAVLLTIAVVGVNSYIRSTKEKANDISLESIKKSAVTYVNENYTNESYWVKHDEKDLEYSCVPILELVNKGYLKKEDIESHSTNWKFVKVNRYSSNKTIFSEENGKDVCSWGTDGNRSTTLTVKKVTTSSVEMQASCIPNENISGYSFGLNADDFGDELRSNIYKFSNLISGDEYQFKARCNYTDGVDAGEAISENIEVGSTDASFILSNVKTGDSLDKIYKSVKIKFSSSNVTYPSYYFKTSSSGNISNKSVMVCGNGKLPSSCEDYSGTLQKGVWYKLKEGNEVELDVYSSSIVYAKVWDGERYSTNKSIQVTFPNNPYVVLDVSHTGYDNANYSYYGENNETLKYNVGKWLNNPTITWKVYGAYKTTSYVYYSNNNESQTTRNNYNSNYKFTGSNSSITTNDYGGELKNIEVGGLQEIGIEVEDIKTKKRTIIKVWVDLDLTVPTVSNIGGGTTLKATSQELTLKCSDNVAVTAYYWGTTEPKAASAITTTTTSDLTSLKGNGLKKKIDKEGTYWLGCKDAAGNFAKKSIVIRKYVVNNLLETIAGKTGTYKSSNYISVSTGTYYIKNGTKLTLSSIYTKPTGGGTFKGYSTSYGTTTVTPSTTSPTVAANNTTTYYMWFNRNTYTVTVTKHANGKTVAQTVTQGSNSVTVNAGASSNGSLIVKYGDTVKATATASTGYSFSSWSGGYVSGTTNPITGTAVTAAKTISASFKANELVFSGSTITKTFSTSSQKATITAASNGTGSYTYAERTEKNASGTSTNFISISGTTITIAANATAGTYTYVVRASDNNSKVTKDATYTIKITAKSLTSSMVTINPASYEYDGNAKTPIVTVKDGSTTLTKDTHYTVAYSNNTNVGTGTVTITGKGNYIGTITKTFMINDTTAPAVTVSVSNQFTGKIINGPTDYEGGSSTINYNGGKWTNIVPTVYIEIEDYSTTKLTINYNVAGNYEELVSYNSTKYVTRTWDSGYEGDSNHIDTVYNAVADTTAEFYVGSSGKRQIRIYVEDTLGNATTVIINANVDYIQPSPPSLGFHWEDSMSIKGATDNGQSGIGGYGYRVYKNGTLYSSGSNQSDYEIYVPISEFSVGTYDVYGFAVDNAGSSSDLFYSKVDIASKSTSASSSCPSGYKLSGGICSKSVSATCSNTYEIFSASNWNSNSCWVAYESGWTAYGCMSSGRAWYTGDGGKCIRYYCKNYYSCTKTYTSNPYTTTTTSCPEGYGELENGLCYLITNEGD